MKRTFLIAVGLLIVGCGVAWTQGPDRREGGGPERGGRGDNAPRGDHRSPPHGQPLGHNPLMNALDPNHDHVISAEEIQAAATALLKLDKNGDGELSEEEFRPDGPPPPPPRDRESRGDRGPRDAGPGDAGRGREGRGRGERPPRDDGDRPRRKGPPDRGFGPPPGGPGGPDSPRGFGGPGGPDGLRGFGGPGGPDGPRGLGGPVGPGGPPNPERFVEHVLEFDANKDGMLDKQELLKFAEEMGRRRGGPGGGGGPGMRRPDGPRDGDRPGDNSDQQRPEHPERPPSE